MWKIKHQLREEEKGGEGQGGAGDGGNAITPEVQALIDNAVTAATTGLNGKNRELLGKLKESSEKLKSFDGIDADAVRNILKRFSDDEEAALIAKGEIDTVLNKRTERMKANYEKETLAEKQKREAAEARAQKFTQRVLENHIRAAASEAGLHKHAVDDALFRAQSVFAIDDEGNPIAGEDIFGKDGKPLALKEWFEGMKEKAPHWWPAANGGGANSSSAATNSKTVTRTQFDAMSQQERSTFAKAGGKVVD